MKLEILILALCALLLMSDLVLVPPEGLTEEGLKAILLFFVCLILWITQVLPLAITGILAFAFIPLIGIMSPSETYSLFGNSSVFFILGAFILAAALMKSGITMRLALLFISRFRKSPEGLLSGIMASAGFLAFWMPAHAVAALLFPIVLEISESLELERGKSNYGKALFLHLAWGSIIGGVATFLGGARNPLAIGILKETYGLDVDFFDWIVKVFPTVAVTMVTARIILYFFFPTDIEDISKAEKVLASKIEGLGPVTVTEKKVGIIIIGTILSWIFLSKSLGLATIALLSTVVIFITHSVTWEDVESYVSWGILLMYSGAIAMASALDHTGAAEWFARSVLAELPLSPFMLIVLMTFIALVLTEAISNVAAVAILLPIGFSLGSQYGINPVVMVYIVAISSGFAFNLPMGTPPNAICFSSGYYKVKDVMKPGILLSVVSRLIFLFMALYYWKLIGLDISAVTSP